MKTSRDMKKTVVAGFTMTTLAILLSGCGGTGGGGLNVSSLVTAAGPLGKVTDAYVNGATVMFDINDDGICGNMPNELAAAVKTDAAGNFNFPPAVGQTHIACATGGTDLATGQTFVGELKAPAGATQITPLTTLIQANLMPAAGAYVPPTAAQITTASTTIANNLGLTGTNLLTADPVALAPTTPLLAQTTTAVQTMLVQTSANVAAAATNGTPSPAQTAALYNSAVKGVTQAVAAQVVPVNLSTSTPAAVNTLVTNAVKNTVTAVQTAPAANPAIVAAFTPAVVAGSLTAGSATAMQAANVAAVASTNITTSTQTVAQVAATTLVAPATPGVASTSLNAQTALTGAAATATIASTGLLNATNVALATSQTGLAVLTNIAAAQNAVTPGTITPALQPVAVTTAMTAAAAPAPAVVAPIAVAVPTPVAPVNNLVLAGATVTGAGAAVPVATGAATVVGPVTSATWNFGAATGTPVTSPTVAITFDVRSAAAGDNRILSGTLSGLTVVNGVLTVPATATASIAGTHQNGATATATAAGATIAPWVTGNIAANGSATLNVGALLNSLIATPVTATNAGFATLNLLKGSFYVTVSLSGVALSSAGFPVTSQTILVNVN